MYWSVFLIHYNNIRFHMFSRCIYLGPFMLPHSLIRHVICISVAFMYNVIRIHSFFHSFIYVLINSFIHSFTHSLIHPFIHSFIHSFNHSLMHSFTYSFIHLFYNPHTSFGLSFIRSFALSFILWLINSYEELIKYSHLRQCCLNSILFPNNCTRCYILTRIIYFTF